MNVRVFVNGLNSWAIELQEALTGALKGMQLSDQALPLKTFKCDVIEVAVALFFSDGSAQLTARESAEIRNLLSHRVWVIPVVNTVDDFRRKVPAEFGKLNAFALGDLTRDWDGLVAEVIDRAWNLRSARKIFISYRRIDSAAIAEQLQSALTHRGYQVFLDESSILPGADFQRELMSWLNDSDFMLVLASPRLDESQWVLAEIERANLSSVAVLGICWPYSSSSHPPKIVNILMEDQKLDLVERDLNGNASAPADQKLSKSKLRSVVNTIDCFRALAIRNRLTDLIPLFQDCAAKSKISVSPADRFGDFRLTRDGIQIENYVRITPFRPTLNTLIDLATELEGQDDVLVAACFYFENDMDDPQKNGLDWATKPDRPANEDGPKQYRLLAYDGEDLNLDMVKPNA